MMLFNSKIDTRFVMDFKNGFDKKADVEYTGGDGTVPAIGPLYACKHWGGESHSLV